MGDGAIVEFGSVVDAVVCAVAVQRAVGERQAGVNASSRIMFRIGVNLGDLVIDGDDLLGDGINVAARLQQISDPGGVLISGAAFDQLKGKLDLEIESRGRHRLKNIGEPVRVYRVRMTPAAGGWVAPRLGWRPVAALVLLIGIAFVAWLRPWQPTLEVASPVRMAFPLPNKPSIAVLPFKNMSASPGQDYFVDGLTDDLITDLSKIAGLFVIARDSVFQFKGHDPKVRDVAESLGVRYVVDGAVRRAENTVRVNVQLTDATTGRQLWADRYDGSLDDIFAVQDRFVRVIVDSLALKLSDEEVESIGRGQTNNIDAREAFQQGWERISRFTPEENSPAFAELRRAIELDPGYGRAYAALGLAAFRSCAWAWTQPAGMNRSQTCELATRNLEATKRHPSSLAHVVATYIDLSEGRTEAAFTEAARALALDPNDPDGYVAMTWVMIATGRPQAGLEFMRTAMRLNPSYPSPYALARGLALYSSGAVDEAARVLKEALDRNAAATELAPPLAAIYAQLGRRAEARDLLLRWRPAASQEELDNIAFVYPYAYQWSFAAHTPYRRLVDGMIIAALPLSTGVSELTNALQRGSVFDRARTARMLGRFGAQAADAVPALIDALGDPSPVVRSAAISALGSIGAKAKPAVPALTAIRDDRLRPIAEAAVSAIGAD
jgi:TolB-like protein/Flp pilus assembly protein TadD